MITKRRGLTSRKFVSICHSSFPPLLLRLIGQTAIPLNEFVAMDKIKRFVVQLTNSQGVQLEAVS